MATSKTDSELQRLKRRRKKKCVSHRVEAHPGHGQPALDGRVHDDPALAPPQVGERGISRVNVSPEVDVLLRRSNFN
jgi:hypothetical protein